VNVINSTVSGNSADYAAGGIANAGTLTVVNSTLASNQVGLHGYAGGLYNVGTATLANSTISGNHGGDAGGGVFNGGDLTLPNVTIANNDAYTGGGLYNAACGCGTATLQSSTLSGNYATQIGGGIANSAGTVNVINSIVAGNGAGHTDPDVAAL